MRWINTKFPGIRYREHEARRIGVRKDRYYAIRIMVDGQRTEESLGWESQWKQSHPEGTISLEQEAVRRRAELLKHQQEGSGPTTLRQQRAENKAKCEAELAAVKAEIDAQKTLEQYWDESYFPAAQMAKKECSWIKEGEHFRKWINPVLGDVPLKSIDLARWDVLTKSLSVAGLSPRSRQYICGTLSRCLRYAYDRGFLDNPPLTGKRIGVPNPGNSNRRQRVISYEEEAAIMGELLLRDPWAWRLTRFCFLTGARLSEAAGLTWGAVAFQQGIIVFGKTKNRDSRSIPITPPLAELFSTMTAGRVDAHVFVREDRTPFRRAPSAFGTVVEHLGLNDGRGRLDRIVFHSVRHSVATRLAQRLSVRDLMDLLGWRKVEMALRYCHGNEGAKAAALSSLGTAPEPGKILPFNRTETA
jgi:integrase